MNPRIRLIPCGDHCLPPNDTLWLDGKEVTLLRAGDTPNTVWIIGPSGFEEQVYGQSLELNPPI